MNFADRFELLDLLREQDDVQTFRARERATGRDVEVHVSASPGDHPLTSVIDRGMHDGKYYVVSTPPLDSAGAWRINAPPVSPQPTPEPGDFTRMFQLKQAPEPVSLPAPSPKPAAPAASSQPGDFTRAIQKPAAASPAVPDSAPGQPGDFTRMFQQPVAPMAVPQVPPAASNPERQESSRRFSTALIVGATLVLCAIAVFVLMKAL